MILVTGSSGFIGRNLINHLEKSGKQVYKLDRLDGDVFEQLVKVPWEQIDFIYHQGAIANTMVLDVADIYKHNIQFSIALMELAIQHEIPIHYASSAAVYGNTIKDGTYGYNPLTYYALGKLTVDFWVFENRKKFKHVVGFRYFNVYGANEKKSDFASSPIYKFTEQAKTDGFISIYKGSENTYRDFTCVEDIVNVITKEYEDGIYDIGPSSPINFLDVAQLVSDKHNVPIKFTPMPEILKGKYQIYTKSRKHTQHTYKSVEEWLKEN